MRLQLRQLRGWSICMRTVADFGLAKFCNRESHVTMSGGKGTPGYAAPKQWMPFAVTYKCDVYSFGLTLFQMVGWRRNFEVNETKSQQWFPLRVWKKFESGELGEMIMLDCKIEEENRKSRDDTTATRFRQHEGHEKIYFQSLVCPVFTGSTVDSSKGGSEFENSSGGLTSLSTEN
ncbi:hypothetical protein NE237_017801 [Protea cynaroides]|uniref:Protein kinase domain-containing protein n=1 Tax=Protea cynaroides TaxID=273540 RepID=A0A9Q0QND5_9MAGN|nr:hypothetical protein NE237_017801 [Protea cynaroides]